MWKLLSLPFRALAIPFRAVESMRRVKQFAHEILNSYMFSFGNRSPTSIPESWMEKDYGFSVHDAFFADVKRLYQTWSSETGHLVCPLPPTPLGIEYIISIYSVTFCYAVSNKLVFIPNGLTRKEIALVASSVDSEIGEFYSFFLTPASEVRQR